jgi:hypothetical protein
MKKIHWLLIAVFTFASLAPAQEKLLTIDEIFAVDPKARVNFSGSPTFGLRWSRDGTSFMQTRVEAGVLRITQADAVSSQEKEFYSGSEIAQGLEKIGLSNEAALKVANNPAFVFNETANRYLFNSGEDLFVYDIQTRTTRRLTSNREQELEADFSPTAKRSVLFAG